MSFEIDGVTWEPQSTSEHAKNLLDKLNALLRDNNIKNESGDLLQLSPNFASALYLLILADANRYADNDAVLAAAINSLNPALCDESQIENLLPIAGIERNPGSFSKLKLECKVAPGNRCIIPAGTRAPFNDVFFVVTEDVTIDNTAGQDPIVQNVQTICDTIGPVVVLSGEIKAFENSIAGLDSVENKESSVPGVAADTTNDLRQRLTQGKTIKYTLEGCKDAIEELPGIAYARVYFNFNVSTELELPGGVVIEPRTAYIVVYGSSFDGLAEVYTEYMSAPTQNAAVGPAAHVQNYITNSGQEIPIHFDTASEKIVYVKIVLAADADDTEEIEGQLKRDLLDASTTWEIGQDVTSLLVGEPFINTTYTKVAYCQVSEDGEVWSQLIPSECNVIPRVTDATIEVEILD